MAAAAQATTVSGPAGAVATAHPLATRAAVDVLAAGGSAVDGAVAAQAVICVVMPHAAGLGGDMLALTRTGAGVRAVNGTGRSPAALAGRPSTSGGSSVTVPGLVDGWLSLHAAGGRLPLPEVLRASVELADGGVHPDPALLSAVRAQLPRLVAGGAAAWPLVEAATAGGPVRRWRQPELADLLRAVAGAGREAFYTGGAAEAVAAAAVRHGGSLSVPDLAAHDTPCPEPVAVPWAGVYAHVQPPASQGVLLAMALRAAERIADGGGTGLDDHLLVEITEAAFEHRSSCGRGPALLEEELRVDPRRASRRGGPRAYLHTAGVAVVDRDGQAVSSLVSVFDDFGSAVFVPELGIVLNNRAAGFTDGGNAPAPAKRPVHTLAPALLTDSRGGALAIATPGADGQVQTLLQVLTATAAGDRSLTEAVSAPRWRSQGGELMVERGHPAAGDLRARGHAVVETEPGADMFGAVVAAGTSRDGTFAVADWRRGVSAEVAP